MAAANHPDDATLARAASEGSQEALATIHDRYAAGL